MWFDGDPAGLWPRSFASSTTGWITGCAFSGRQSAHQTGALLDHVLGEIKRTDPDVLFLAEAFTRPPMMRALAKSVSTSRTRTSPGATRSGNSKSTCVSSADRPRRSCGRTSSSTPRHPAFLPAVRRSAAFSIRATLGATMSPRGAVQRLRIVRACGRATRQRGVLWTPRSTSTGRATGTRPPPRARPLRRTSPCSTRSGANIQHCKQLRHIVFQQIDSDRMVAFSKRDGDDTIIVVDPRPVRAA